MAPYLCFWRVKRSKKHVFRWLFQKTCFFCACLLGVSVLALADAYAPDYLFGDALSFYFLLSWSEAFTTGLMLAIFVVYKPHWVATFDDRRYLLRK